MRVSPTWLVLAAVVALPSGVAKADECTCTGARGADIGRGAEICLVASMTTTMLASLPTLATTDDEPLSADPAVGAERERILASALAIAIPSGVMPSPAKPASRAAAWCGGEGGARCEPATPPSSSNGPHAFALPILLLPPRLALPSARASAASFRLEPVFGSDGISRSIDRPPSA